MKTLWVLFLILVVGVILLAGCGPAATATPVPPVATRIPPTNRPIQPTPTLTPLPVTPAPLLPTVPQIPTTNTPQPSPASLLGQQVAFQTEDGVQIAGTLYGAGEIAIILAHQGTPGADQTTWQQFATTLAENGFTALTFDFRGGGQSGGVLEYGQLDKDVRAAVHYLQSQQYRKIVCAGASMGGTACLRVAIDDKPFIGLIVLASTMAVRYNELRILPEEMGGLTQPKLFITAEEDSYLVVRDTNRMYKLSPEPKKLLLLAGTEHGTDLFQTRAGEELTGAMLDFLDSLSKSAQISPAPVPPAPTNAEDALPPLRVVTTANARDVVLLRTFQIPGFSQSAVS